MQYAIAGRFNLKLEAASYESTKYCIVLASIISLIVIFQGCRIDSDSDLSSYFIELAHGKIAIVNPHIGFKFEGIFADAGLYIAGKYSPSAQLNSLAFWFAGLTVFAVCTYVSFRNGTVSQLGLLYLLAFSRLVDTLSMWIGKTDTWLLAFVVLSANRARWLSILGIVLAAFVHPMIAALSTVGIVLADACYERESRWISAIIATLASVVALVCFHKMFPNFEGRSGYLLQQLTYIGLRGIEDGLPSLVSSVCIPALAILVLAGVKPVSNLKVVFALIIWFVGVGILTSFFTLDHTRDACLITFAASIVWLRHQDLGVIGLRGRTAAAIFVALFVSRLDVPHYDQDGAHIFRWMPLIKWAEPIIGRIFTADTDQCKNDHLRCVYYHNDQPEVRRSTL